MRERGRGGGGGGGGERESERERARESERESRIIIDIIVSTTFVITEGEAKIATTILKIRLQGSWVSLMLAR